MKGSKEMTRSISTPHDRASERKPKGKTFLGNEDTLNLALNIARSQEENVSQKKQNRAKRETAPVKPEKGKSTSRSHSAWRSKVKETKALLLAQKAQKKKEKSKKLKEGSGSKTSAPQSEPEKSKPARKSVSFA